MLIRDLCVWNSKDFQSPRESQVPCSLPCLPWASPTQHPSQLWPVRFFFSFKAGSHSVARLCLSAPERWDQQA